MLKCFLGVVNVTIKKLRLQSAKKRGKETMQKEEKKSKKRPVFRSNAKTSHLQQNNKVM